MMEITKEELNAYTEATIKTATTLEKIADRLEDIVIKQGVIEKKITDEVGKDIADIKIKATATDLCAKTMHEDVKWVKILWTILACVIGLGLVVLEIIHKVIK